MLELLITKNLKYAASTTNAAVDSATDINTLAVGAIGVYVQTLTGSLVLVPSTGLTANAVATQAGVPIDQAKFVIALGSADGTYTASNFSLAEVIRLFGSEYAAASKQIAYLGYNGTDATSNIVIRGTDTVSTFNSLFIKAYDEGSVLFEERQNTTGSIEDRMVSSAFLNASMGAYDVVSAVAQAVNADGKYLASVVADGTITALTTATNFVFTKGSNLVTTTGTAAGVAANDLLFVNVNNNTNVLVQAIATSATGQVYKVVSVAAGLITLDKPFTGESGTVALAASLGKTTPSGSTKYGIRFTTSGVVGYGTYASFTIGTDGGSSVNSINTSVFAGSTITYVGLNQGSGTLDEITRLETKSFPSKGNYILNDPIVPRPVSQVNTGISGYDKYNIEFVKTSNGNAGELGYTRQNGLKTIVVAFEAGARGAGDAQTVFDTVFKTVMASVAETTPITLGNVTAAS